MSTRKEPWNRWYHCMGSTYGAWLYGDPRGFRTRHHREHVEGDYRNPPPAGSHDREYRRSLEGMRFGPVTLSVGDRRIVCLAMGRKLLEYGVELVELAVGGRHFHVLCRFPLALPSRADGSPRRRPRNLLADGRDPIPRHILGRAKRAASVELVHLSRKQRGRPLWAKRTKIEPVRSRAHQLAVVQYLRDHAPGGALLWSQIGPEPKEM